MNIYEFTTGDLISGTWMDEKVFCIVKDTNTKRKMLDVVRLDNNTITHILSNIIIPWTSFELSNLKDIKIEKKYHK